MIKYGKRNLKVIYDVENCIVGGGTAGIAAAISSLNSGLKTLVIEKGLALGGTQTRALVSPLMVTNVEQSKTAIEIFDRLIENGDRPVQGDYKGKPIWFNGETLSYTQEQLILEKGGEILYDATLVDCIIDCKKIEYIILSTIEGLVAVKSKTFVDSTGNANLSRLAGVETEAGDKNGDNQCMSLRFEMANIDLDILYSYMKEKKDTFCGSKPPYYEIAMVPNKGFVLEEDFLKGVELGLLKEHDIKYFQAFSIPTKTGGMTFNCPEVTITKNATDAKEVSKAIMTARESIRRVVNFLVKSIPGFENAYLSKEAEMLGIRESHRIKGKYILTEEDYIKRTKFDDGVVKCDWYLDIHGYGGDKYGKIKYQKGEYYEIPYRSLVTDEIENVIVIGRCISTNFIMQSSIRIQASCYSMGDIAGKACKLAIENDIDLNSLNGGLLKG